VIIIAVMCLLLCCSSFIDAASATVDTLTRIETLTDGLCTINSDVEQLNISFADVLAQACATQSLSAALESKLSNFTAGCSVNDQVALSVTDVSQSKLDRSSSITDEIEYYVDAAAECRGTPITGVTTISSPGKYYVANDIIQDVQGFIINITSSDVYLDLNGRTIYNPRDSAPSFTQFGCIRVYVTGGGGMIKLENVTIANGYLRAGANTGPYFDNFFPKCIALGPIDFFMVKNVHFRGVEALDSPGAIFSVTPQKHIVIKNIKCFNLLAGGFNFSYATTQNNDAGPFLFRGIEDYRNNPDTFMDPANTYLIRLSGGTNGRRVSNTIIRDVFSNANSTNGWGACIRLGTDAVSALMDGLVLRAGRNDSLRGIDLLPDSGNSTIRNCRFGSYNSSTNRAGNITVRSSNNAVFNNVLLARAVYTQDQWGIWLDPSSTNNYVADNVVNGYSNTAAIGGYDAGFVVSNNQNSLVGNYCFNPNGITFSGAVGTVKTVTISQSTGFPGGTPIPSRWDNINMTT